MIKELNKIWKKFGFPYKLRLKDLTSVEMKISEKNRNGYFDGSTIYINPKLNETVKTSTLFHELTHYKNKEYFKKVKDPDRINWEIYFGQNIREILKIKKMRWLRKKI